MTSEPPNPIDGQQSTTNRDRETTDHPQETKSSSPPSAAEANTQPRCKHPEITCHTKRDWIDKTTLWFEGFGLFVLVIYTIATIAIWCANKTAAYAAKSASDTAASAFRSGQRAWIQPDYEAGPLRILPHSTLQEPLTITNTGNTPAYGVEGFAILELLDSKDSPRFDYSTGNGRTLISVGMFFAKNPRSLPIQAVVGDKFPNKGVDVSDVMIEKYNHGDAYSALFGEITYRDIFQHPHWIHFCSAREARPATSLADGRKACADYNQTDGDIE